MNEQNKSGSIQKADDQMRKPEKDADILLSVRELKVHFPVKQGVLDTLFSKKETPVVKAVDGISFDLERGCTLALVGESGCGKTTTGRALIGLNKPTSGTITFDGNCIERMDYESLQRLRRKMQFVFQDPYSSLNPRMTVYTTLERSMLLNHICKHNEIRERAEELMRTVGLLPSQLARYPHEFSGGQRQRISVARALAVEPELIIADEPTAALDVSIQCQILNLLLELKERLSLTMIFITHDLSVVNYIADTVAVMYLGKIVEFGPTKKVFRQPSHPYTKALLDALPRRQALQTQRNVKLQGFIPSPVHPPSGCALHPRCPYAREQCTLQEPPLLDRGGVLAACHLLQTTSAM
jgi:oligopeptide transport system ATP-binding protein